VVLTDGEQRARLARARDSGDAEERRRATLELLDDFRAPALAVIHKTLRASGLDRSSVEDVFQAAALRFIASGIASYRGDASPRSYFLRIALHAALDQLRARRREPRGPDELQDVADPGGSVEQRLQLRREREALEACLRELPASLARAVALYYFEQLGDCARCAEALGVRRNAFEQRLSRARTWLAGCVGRRLGPGGGR
jgi:RNA polymerase sigma-70 factor, ECF subfamily